MLLPLYSEFEKHWNHNKEIVFLNHGSFGSCPTSILEKQTSLRTQMESELVRFMTVDLENLYWENKTALATFVNCNANDLVLVRNATMGVNTILHSLHFNEGDEILTHSHAYGACQNTLKYYAEKYKCKLVIADIPFPITNQEDVTEAFLKCVTPKTRLAMVDHITSATGIVFPVEQITKELEAKGVEVLVDGAHAPGMVHLDINKISASYYTGNCHKWICSPKGSALLHVRKDKQHKISPLQISHYHDLYSGTDKHWSAQFIWPGTEDFTAYLLIKDSIETMGSMMGTWDALRKRNRELCLKARKMLSEKAGTPLPAPENMISHLSDIVIDMKAEMPKSFLHNMPLPRKILLEDYKIQVPVFIFGKAELKYYLRIAVQAYNSWEQYEYLGDCLEKMIKLNHQTIL